MIEVILKIIIIVSICGFGILSTIVALEERGDEYEKDK